MQPERRPPDRRSVRLASARAGRPINDPACPATAEPIPPQARPIALTRTRTAVYRVEWMVAVA